MAFLKLTLLKKNKSINVPIMVLNKFFCRFSISTGVLVIGTSYVIIDLLRLFYHLIIFFFPGPLLRQWYSAGNQKGDTVHGLITDTMMKNRIQAMSVLVLDLLTDIGLLMSVNSGLISVTIWLVKSIFMAVVYLVVILALVFAYDRTWLALTFMAILAIELYFLVIVAMHFVQLRRSSDLNDENPNETAV
ncbi:uncharacterized protein [Drosophila takahashii]|uniref:uncharacterized protein isoform X1 n=2 Tax=Drosophila takahashii TaxID=29030 RepID=UPI003898EA75